MNELSPAVPALISEYGDERLLARMMD